jgi:hypothetical protein
MSKRTILAFVSAILFSCTSTPEPSSPLGARKSSCTSDIIMVMTDNGKAECPPGTTMIVRPARSDEHAFVFVFCDCPNAATPRTQSAPAVPAESQPSPAQVPGGTTM